MSAPNPTPRLYLDSDIIIHLVEGTPAWAEAAERLRRLWADGLVDLATSEFTLCEVMTKPLALGRDDLMAAYDAIIAPGRIEPLPATRSVFTEAARLRSDLGLKTADALHVASASLSGCSHFMTEDTRIRVPDGLALRRISAL
jgi:predicted nucleic acid-binding protein